MHAMQMQSNSVCEGNSQLNFHNSFFAAVCSSSGFSLNCMVGESYPVFSLLTACFEAILLFIHCEHATVYTEILLIIKCTMDTAAKISWPQNGWT